jgi:hypothetical protein
MHITNLDGQHLDHCLIAPNIGHTTTPSRQVSVGEVNVFSNLTVSKAAAPPHFGHHASVLLYNLDYGGESAVLLVLPYATCSGSGSSVELYQLEDG